jgi:hypothetical protein
VAKQTKKQSSGFLIVGISILLGLALIGAAAYTPIKNELDQRKLADTSLSDIGGPASVCQKVTTKPASGNQDHVPDGSSLNYPDAPPAFGRHYDIWESMDRQIYSAKDRPALGRLVHNQEHGFTVVWFDETAAKDDAMMDDLRAIAGKFTDTSNLRNKLKVAPWLEEDGKAFPEGQHIAFTHWSKGGIEATSEEQQVGVWQYCTEPSGAALGSFVDKYPYLDSAEPDVVDVP